MALLTAPPDPAPGTVVLTADPTVPADHPYSAVVFSAGGPAPLTFEVVTDRVGAWPPGGSVYLIFNNADPARLDEFSAWYDEHLAHAMEHLGFTGAQRMLAPPGVLQPYRHLVVYAVPDGGARDCEERRLAVQREREAALAAGREPLVPVTTAIVPPRLAGFYRRHSSSS